MMGKLAFWGFVLVFDLLVPGLMIGLGKKFMKHPPTEINPGYGYRTTMSSKNQDTWDFAQKHMGKVWYQAGRMLLIPSVVPLLFVLGQDVGTVGYVGMAVSGVQIAVMLSSIAFVERTLRKTFDKNGNRR